MELIKRIDAVLGRNLHIGIATCFSVLGAVLLISALATYVADGSDGHISHVVVFKWLLFGGCALLGIASSMFSFYHPVTFFATLTAILFIISSGNITIRWCAAVLCSILGILSHWRARHWKRINAKSLKLHNAANDEGEAGGF
jgi:hypothetical protein